MLVNQIIPHHHHDTEACFETKTTCPLETDNSKNNQGNEDNCALCSLYHALITPTEQVQKGNLHPVITPVNDFFGLISIACNTIAFDAQLTPYSKTLFTDSVVLLKSAYHRKGTLRAPPISV